MAIKRESQFRDHFAELLFISLTSCEIRYPPFERESDAAPPYFMTNISLQILHFM